MGVFSSRSIPPSNFQPPRHAAMKLWNIYINSVEGCSGLKLLHLPSDELKVYSVINDLTMATAEPSALNFSIYFASLVSLTDAESEALLGQNRNMALSQFKAGLEQSFAHCDFLDCPTITCLQALAVYLSALRVCNRGKGMWILDGLAIRIAQSLGLHRDGKRLGLPPFQSEVRRRLWWHLLNRGSRSGEDYGLETSNTLLLTSDVDLPSNIHDTDIHPDIQDLPKARNEWTAMSYSLIFIEISQMMQTLANMTATSPPSRPPSEKVRARIINETKARVEARLKYCNVVVPENRRALLCSRFLLRKHDFVTRLQWILLRAPSSFVRSKFISDPNLVEALELLDFYLFTEDGLLAQFSWVRKAYPQYHITMYVLWYLCVQPQGPNTDRAWEAVDKVFSQEFQDTLSTNYESKTSVLVRLRAKAHSEREGVQNLDSRQNSEEIDDELPRIAGGRSCVTEGTGCTGRGENETHLHGSDNDWIDWTAFIESFQLDSPTIMF